MSKKPGIANQAQEQINRQLRADHLRAGRDRGVFHAAIVQLMRRFVALSGLRFSEASFGISTDLLLAHWATRKIRCDFSKQPDDCKRSTLATLLKFQRFAYWGVRTTLLTEFFWSITMNRFIYNSFGAIGLMLSITSFAAGNLTVAREVTVDQPPATVWKLLREFNSLDVWLPPVQSSEAKGNLTQPGAMRILDLGGGASVTEKLLAFDDVKRSYSYAFIKVPLPVKNYVAAIELTDAPGGKTLIKWHSTFDAFGAPDEKAKEAIQGIYDAGLGKLAIIFKK